MKELRPLGSERLSGDEKIKRILEIANYGRTSKPSNIDKPEYVTESKNGTVYGIVKEKDGFYVKQGLNENSLEYIGGMFMKNKNRFPSYGEAFKRLEFIKGQEVLQEATKYVLKQNKPTPPPMEATPPEPSMNDTPPPSNDIPPIPTGEEPSPENTPAPEGLGGEEGMGGEEGQNLRSGYMAEIQKYAGKLGQELRDQKDRLESDDIKYTLNMIISALDLDKLDDEDLEEIADKFDREEEEFDNQGGEDFGGEEPAPEVDDDEEELAEFVNDLSNDDDEDLHGFYSRHDLGGNEEIEFDDNDEINFYDQDDDDDFELDETMSMLNDFINTDIDEEPNLFSKYSDIGNDEEELDELIHLANPEPSHYNDFENSDENSDEDLLGKYTKFEYNGEEFAKPRFRTKPVERQTPKFDIDEITNAVNNAIKASLSKYK